MVFNETIFFSLTNVFVQVRLFQLNLVDRASLPFLHEKWKKHWDEVGSHFQWHTEHLSSVIVADLFKFPFKFFHQRDSIRQKSRWRDYCFGKLACLLLWQHFKALFNRFNHMWQHLLLIIASAANHERGDLIWKFAKTLWGQKFFLHLWGDKPLWGDLKLCVGSNICYYTSITTLI